MLDQKFTVSVVEEKDGYAKLAIEPLAQGYGHTLGNSLRRVLLSSLTGSAVTSVKVKGVKHQFTTLKGMNEDVVQLILNLKNLNVRIEDEEVELKLEATGPGEVTASQIVTPTGVTIGNPELVIANLADKKSTLEATIKVGKGTGYSLADERKSDVIGEIPVDALYSPVRRANVTVSATRVGRRTDFDKLTLEMWTDNTITPKEALEEASKILVDQFSQIYDPQIEITEDVDSDEDKYPNEVLKLTVEELDLPTRIANALRKGGYATVEDLTKAKRAEIVKVKNLGERSVKLVDDALAQKDVILGEDA